MGGKDGSLKDVGRDLNPLEYGLALGGAAGGIKGILRGGFGCSFVTRWFAKVLVSWRLLKDHKLARTR